MKGKELAAKIVLCTLLLLAFTQNFAANSTTASITYCVPDCNVITSTEVFGGGIGNPDVYVFLVLVPEQSVNELSVIKNQVRVINFFIYNNSPQVKLIEPKFSFNSQEIFLFDDNQNYRFEPQQKKEFAYKVQFVNDSNVVKSDLKISFSDGFTTKSFLFKLQEKKVLGGQTIFGLNQTDFFVLLVLILLVLLYWKRHEVIDFVSGLVGEKI